MIQARYQALQISVSWERVSEIQSIKAMLYHGIHDTNPSTCTPLGVTRELQAQDCGHAFHPTALIVSHSYDAH